LYLNEFVLTKVLSQPFSTIGKSRSYFRQKKTYFIHINSIADSHSFFKGTSKQYHTKNLWNLYKTFYITDSRGKFANRRRAFL